jgi:exoribonuclease R
MLKGQTPRELDYLVNLSNKRSEDVTYHLNLPSVRLDIDKDTGLAKNLHVECTNDPSHNLVATAMVLANLVVSKHLNHCNVKLPNRFHDSLRGFTQNQFTTTNNTLVDSFILVKRYARANYSVDKKGHFGLGLTDYVHFTSPMRRYADVLVHRILAGQQIETDILQNEVDWLNYRSQMVRSLQDLYTHWKVIRHLDKNQTYTVYVTDVKKTGVLWFMPSMSLNGYSHVSTLKPSQYWAFDKCTLQGLDKQLIKVGNVYQATIISIDPITYMAILTLNIK